MAWGMGQLSVGGSQRQERPEPGASGSYEAGAFVVRHGYDKRDLLKAAGFTWCSPDKTWRRAMTREEYDAFDMASIGMRRTGR